MAYTIWFEMKSDASHLCSKILVEASFSGLTFFLANSKTSLSLRLGKSKIKLFFVKEMCGKTRRGWVRIFWDNLLNSQNLKFEQIDPEQFAEDADRAKQHFLL